MPAPSWIELRARSIAVPTHVVFRDLSQETVILNVQTGQYHGVDPIGARFFAAIREAATLSDAAGALASEYGQPRATIETDLAAFVGQMLGFGLIELKPTGH